VTAAPEDSLGTEYSDHVRQIVDTPARFNANPRYLYEASGSAGKLMVFAVRTRTFPKDEHTTTFYLGTNSPAELEAFRRAVLSSEKELPISGEYMGRAAFDLAEKYGKDTYVGLKYAGSGVLKRAFALKSWANGVFAKLPFFGETTADTISQNLFGLLPSMLPKRMVDYRNRFEHHLIVVVGQSQKQDMESFLTSFFAEPGREGEFFTCTDDEAEGAMLQRFGAASAMTRYHNLKTKSVGELVTLDVALRRDDEDWLEVLPAEIADKLEVISYYGHFFCHVMHQDYVAKKGVDGEALKAQMKDLLTERGARFPAEHNYGRIYHAPDDLVEHYKELDPTNMFNPGVGETSAHKSWA
jgi:D-lactate dehydrogenase